MFGISRNCAENQSYYYLITSRPMSLSAKIQDPLFQKPGPKDKTFLPNFQRANLVHQLHQPAWAGPVSPDSNCCLWQNLFTLARRAKRSNREKGHPPTPAASAVPGGQKIPVRGHPAREPAHFEGKMTRRSSDHPVHVRFIFLHSLCSSVFQGFCRFRSSGPRHPRLSAVTFPPRRGPILLVSSQHSRVVIPTDSAGAQRPQEEWRDPEHAYFTMQLQGVSTRMLLLKMRRKSKRAPPRRALSLIVGSNFGWRRQSAPISSSTS